MAYAICQNVGAAVPPTRAASGEARFVAQYQVGMSRFKIQERVRWSDVDAAQIIFYGSYIRFFEFAESEMFRDLGFPYGKMFERLDVWLPRRHIQCDFLALVRLDDLLEVSCWVSDIGRTSLKLAFEVHLPDGTLAATASYVLVAVERGAFQKTAVPADLVAAAAKYRG
jgi:YbgC/YbaW family acyl-CoA thioester hydrolase